MGPAILGVGTVRAPYHVEQPRLASRYEALLAIATSDPRAARRARLIFSRSRVRSRQFAIPDVDDREEAVLYRGPELATTSQRMKVFARVAPEVAEGACRKALEDAGARPEDVSMLVVATCTGVGAPDLDVELVKRLGLSRHVERELLVWMSCTASFPAVRAARNHVGSRPGSLALVVCVEVCSLHVRADPDVGSVVAHSLFADGASAVVVGDVPTQEALLVLGESATRLVPEGRDALRWEFSDHGFRVRLGADLPTLVEKEVASFVRHLVSGRMDEVRSWCVHPGGPSILDAVERALGLSPDALDGSRQVLCTLGNMSSATVWYVLEGALPKLGVGETGVMLGFGTGFTMEGLVFERGGRTR